MGLITKFFLDKSFIFFDDTKDLKLVGRKFSIYTSNGIFSTMIFWGTETIFWLIWRTQNMRELGAILGLTIGYIIKYRLDKKYVFAPWETPEAELLDELFDTTFKCKGENPRPRDFESFVSTEDLYDNSKKQKLKKLTEEYEELKKQVYDIGGISWTDYINPLSLSNVYNYEDYEKFTKIKKDIKDLQQEISDLRVNNIPGTMEQQNRIEAMEEEIEQKKSQLE